MPRVKTYRSTLLWTLYDSKVSGQQTRKQVNKNWFRLRKQNRRNNTVSQLYFNLKKKKKREREKEEKKKRKKGKRKQDEEDPTLDKAIGKDLLLQKLTFELLHSWNRWLWRYGRKYLAQREQEGQKIQSINEMLIF